jgi:hypothetical protein
MPSRAMSVLEALKDIRIVLLTRNRELPMMIPVSGSLKCLTGAPRVPEDREVNRFLTENTITTFVYRNL